MVIQFDGRPTARSEYWRQVRRIAPGYLQDRESELAELAAFCTAPDSDDTAYAWWRAPAWAGKSALMAWFALHPPDGVRVVPFFITSRWEGQSDRIGFTDIVIEQLAEILAEPLPANQTAGTRDVEFLSLLERAAHACAGLGQRLVLLVDGLDEDRGVTTGPDAYSIAALLPDQPQAGMRIIVAGRLNPPIPADVDDDHPLRNPAITCELSPSPVAKVVRDAMRRELGRLLGGSSAERALVGLIATARGGLSAADLAELITEDELSAAGVGELLATVAGRSFVPRPSRWQPDTGPEVYILGHEELQVTAEGRLSGNEAKRYQDRLRSWADGYRDRGWPPGTPEYLLRGYFRMLQSAGDLTSLVELVANRRRHARMLQVTGGDNLALSEIAAAQQALMDTDPPGITAVARLAVHHQSLARRGDELPAGLPAIWARVGAELMREKEITRAKEIARSFTDPLRRCAELLEASHAVEGRDYEHASALAADALTTARGISEPTPRARALADVARMWARLSAIGQATDIIEEARTAAAGIGDQDSRESALSEIAKAAAAAGQLETAMGLAQSVATPTRRVQALQFAAQSAANAGNVSGAEPFVKAIDLPNQRAWALGAVTSALARPGMEAEVRALADRAEAAASEIAEPEWRADMLGAVAHALAVVGEARRARHFIRLARAAARKGARRSTGREVPISVALALAVLGETDDAVRIARGGDPHRLVAVTGALARAGLYDEAEALASEITAEAPGKAAREAARGFLADIARSMDRSDVLPQLEALSALARAAADAGDTDRAIRLCEQIEFATNPGAARFLDQTTPIDLAAALAAAGYADQALALAEAISDQGERELALTRVVSSADYAEHAKILAAIRSWAGQDLIAICLAKVAETAARAGDTALADTLAQESVDLATRQDSPGKTAQLSVLPVAARTMAIIGKHKRACSIAGLLTENDSLRDTILSQAAAAAAEAGHFDGAEIIARAASDPSERAGALARVAKAAASARQPDRARALALASSAEPLGKARPTTTTFAQSGPGFALAGIVDGIGRPDQARLIANALAAFMQPAPSEKGHSATEAAATEPGPGFTVDSFTIAAMRENPRTEVSALIAEVFAAIGDQAQARATADATLATARAIDSPRYRSNALSNAARAMAACGDTDQALSIANEATTAAKDIRSSRKQDAAERTAMQARALIARTATRNGDLAKASTITDSITENDIRAEALTGMAVDLASSGDENSAVEIIQSIRDPIERAKALAAIAKTLANSPAQALIGQALQVGDWEPCLTALASITPAAVAAIANEVSLLSATE